MWSSADPWSQAVGSSSETYVLLIFMFSTCDFCVVKFGIRLIQFRIILENNSQKQATLRSKNYSLPRSLTKDQVEFCSTAETEGLFLKTNSLGKCSQVVIGKISAVCDWN